MKTTLAIAAGLLLATATTSAFAQPYYGGRQIYRTPSPYAEYVRQMRACQRHAREHAELGQAHADEHDEGFDSRGDHRDLHDELGEAHDAYHADHPRADFCNRYMSNPYRPRNGYPQSGYGGYGYNGSGYGYNNGYGGYGYGYGYGR